MRDAVTAVPVTVPVTASNGPVTRYWIGGVLGGTHHTPPASDSRMAEIERATKPQICGLFLSLRQPPCSTSASDSPRSATPGLLSWMKQAKPRVPNRGSFAPGDPRINRSGRPRSGLALAERIRERMSPDELIDLVTKALADESIPIRERVAFAFQLAGHGYSKPPAGLDTTAKLDGSTPDLSHVTDEQLRAALAALEPSGAQPDGATDDNAPTANAACPPRALTEGVKP